MKRIVLLFVGLLALAAIGLVVFSSKSDAAIWSEGSKSYFDKSTSMTSCGIGHCPVLPATSALYCPSGYSDVSGTCTQYYSPATRAQLLYYATYTCSTGTRFYDSITKRFRCSNVISYAYAMNYGGMTVKQATDNCKNVPGVFNYSKQDCTYYTEAKGPCANGGYHSGNGCYQTQYACDGQPWSTSSSGCSRTTGKISTYNTGLGDGNYATYAVIRSGDTSTRSQFFTGPNAGKPDALVQMLRDYYNGSHTNIAASGGNTAYAKTGAAFVVNTLLGRPQGSSREITSQDFDTLASVLKYLDGKGLIDWNGYVDGNNTEKLNTHSVKVGTSFDIERTPNDIVRRSAMIIKDGSGKLLYSLLYACANPYGDTQGIASFDLYPSLTLSPDDIAESGSAVSINPTVDNRDKGSSYQTDWVVSRIIYKNGATPKQGSDGSTQTPAQYFVGSTQVGAGKQDFPQGISVVPQFSTDLPTANPGDRICYSLSLTPYNTTASGWRHSSPVCVVIGKKPKIQVWGGDVRAGRAMSGVTASLGVANIMTSTSVKSGNMYGSWTEYGASATGSITGFGSGSAFAASGGQANASVCTWSVLSISNAPNGSPQCSNSGVIGNYRDNRVIPDVASSFGTGQGAPLVSGTIGVSSLAGITKATGDIVITGGVVAKGRWAVIYAPEYNVRIAGNITYQNVTFRVLEDIPQLVIIARNIDIDAGVTEIDSWLVAKPRADGSQGIINTCREKGTTGALTANDCTQPLTVNGPVMASKLYLRRTAGSGAGPASGDPAERFNLRPDAYLWANTRANTTLRANTVYVRELPPRL